MSNETFEDHLIYKKAHKILYNGIINSINTSNPSGSLKCAKLYLLFLFILEDKY